MATLASVAPVASAVPEFLAEIYVARSDEDAVTLEADRARRAAEALAREGVPVQHLRAIFVPEDETCLFLYEADSAETVREAARRAELAFERVVEAVSVPTDDRRPDH